jgi:hypothetical protein
MPNLLQRGATWHGEKMKTAAGRVVQVTQGENVHDATDAWHELQDYSVMDNEGFVTSVHSWDWRFMATDLPSGFEFRDGDLIKETIGDVISTYEVMPIGSEKCWKPADSSSIQITVHTKQVS